MQGSGIESFSSQFISKHYKAKEYIYIDKGPPLCTLFYLKDGFVRQFLISDEGKELTVHIYSPGSIFPLSLALNNQVFTHTLQAVTRCELNIVSPHPFSDFITAHPQELLSLTQNLLRGIDGLIKRIELVSFDDASSRVMSALRYIGVHFGEVNGKETTILTHFTHEDIAAITGLTRERVSIEMGKLRKAKRIYYNAKLLIIPVENE